MSSPCEQSHRTHAAHSASLRLLFVSCAFALGAAVAPAHATLLYSAVPVSDGGTPSLGVSNGSRSVAAAPDGTVYVAYFGSGASEMRVAASTNRGQSFAPSVQAYVPAAGTNVGGSEIAVNSLGDVYLATADTVGNLSVSRSTDGGQTFTSTTIGTVSSITAGVHVGTDGHRIYAAAAVPGGVGVWASDDDGATFTLTPVAISIAFFNLVVDPVTGAVVVAADTPGFHVRVSSDHGATFGAEQNPPGTDYYSAWTISSGPSGSYLFAAGSNLGGQPSTAARIDLSNFTAVDLPNFGVTATAQSRSIFGDACGNIVDSFRDDTVGGSALHVSNDLGNTFGAQSSVVGAGAQSVFINPAQGDVLFSYANAGAIFLDTYADEVPQACYEPIFDHDSLEFGSVPIGSASPPQSVVITNTAATPIDVVSIGTIGDFAQIGSACIRTLAAGTSCTIPVTFAPTAIGPRPGQLQVATTTAVRTIPLSGTGAPIQSLLTLAISDGSDYARYGQAVRYVVTLTNSGNAAANGIVVGSVYSPAFDAANTSWICIPGAGGGHCAPTGAGPFGDTVDVPANQTLTWVVTAPVFTNSAESAAELQISATDATTVSDVDTLVIFRDGFDQAYSGGRVPASPK